jgi:hypothetical protein
MGAGDAQSGLRKVLGNGRSTGRDGERRLRPLPEAATVTFGAERAASGIDDIFAVLARPRSRCGWRSCCTGWAT